MDKYEKMHDVVRKETLLRNSETNALWIELRETRRKLSLYRDATFWQRLKYLFTKIHEHDF